jgi:uncharacterized repeat protein (TIGR01451 family)
LTIVKSSSAGASVVEGVRVPFTLTITNTGDTPYTGAQVNDNLAGGLDDAVFEPAVIQSGGGTLAYNAPNLVWTGDLPVGAAVTITYAMIIDSPDTGDKNLVDVVTSAEPGSTCPTGPPPAGCRVAITVLTPALTIAKSADVAVTTMGQTVVFTLTIENSGQTPYTGAVVTDALTDVLDDATFGTVAADRGTATLDGQTLRWTGDLAPTEVATVTYSVTVDRSGGNKTLTNKATSAEAGSDCPAGGTNPRCQVTVPVAILSITNTATPTLTVPTGVVVYEMTISNLGAAPYVGLVVTQDFSGVVDDAAANGDAIARSTSRGSIVRSGDTLTWTGDLPVGQTVTVAQSFTVNNPTTGDLTMAALATTTAIGSNCPVSAPAPECTATATVEQPQLTVASTVSAPTATPGQVITVTITATNTGPVAYVGGSGTLGVTLTESAIAMLDDATYNGDATATGVPGQLTPMTGGLLSWTLLGTMAPGELVTITYSVTVNDPPTGNRTMVRQVTATALGSNCQAGDTSTACASSVSVLIPALTIGKTATTSTPAPGDVVRYTVTIGNSGQADYPAGTVVTDNLSGVLTGATYLNDAASDLGTVTVSLPTLTWTGALLVGQSATVTFSVRVNDTAGGQVLTNVVVSDAAGSNCPTGGGDPQCTSAVTVLRPS